MRVNHITCKSILIKNFKPNSFMITAEILKTHVSLKSFALSTIKNNLSILKSEDYLCIGFRIKGKFEKYTKINKKRIGSGKFSPGKCYYKLNQ